MLSKLTLSVDDMVVAEAKAYAEQNGQSLSQIVESYLNSITSIDTTSSKKLPPITKSLLGIAKSKILIKNDKEALLNALSEKYL